MELSVGSLTPGPLADPQAGAEVVEHKGIGHPDTICDALAERLSVELSRHYLDRFGTILHHNVDKALLWGGAARPAFRGGELLAPMEIFLAGRAVCQVDDADVPVEELVLERLVHVAEKVASVARDASPAADRLDVEINAADDIPHQKVYLTVTGTSAEAGDDGQVGRGNRVNGLITPHRPMSLEAAPGKSPVSHAGKIYNLVAHRIAHTAVASIPDVTEAQCYLVSRIGRPVREPEVIDVRVRTRDGRPPIELSRVLEGIARQELDGLDELASALVDGRVQVY